MEAKGAVLALALCGFLAGASGRSVSRVDPKGGSCILDVNKDLPKKNEPLFLVRNGTGVSLLLPETEGRRGIISLRQGEEILIACPGNKNSLAPTSEVVSRAVCKAGTTLSVYGDDYNSDDFDCNSRTLADNRVTQRKCANGKGVIVEIGFNANGFTKLVESCHNLAESKTYYSHHVINGASLAGKVYRPAGTRPGFARGTSQLFAGFNPEASYTQRHQSQVLKTLVGSAKVSKYLDQKSSRFLARGHLAPDADFIFSPHQLLTYFYVNVAPQWQVINAGNWLRVEENTRRAAIRLGDDLEILTGTEGVMRIENQKGASVEYKLQNTRLPVPAHFWKVVRSTRDSSCIAFVSTNDPFLTKAPKPICKDVCSQTGWPSLQDEIGKGYVYCCEFDDFKRAVPEVPDLDCSGTLRGSK